jgi:hypothetical protein
MKRRAGNNRVKDRSERMDVRRWGGTKSFAVVLLLSAMEIACAQQCSAQAFRSDVPKGAPSPWTGTPQTADLPLHFVIFGDRTGMAYPGALDVAIDSVNGEAAERANGLSFVISVGDNIEGYSRDAGETTSMWKAFDESIKQLHVPFFRLPGNHDISDVVMDRIYTERYGRPYYAFTIANVLFLALDTEDGPPALAAEREVEIHHLLEQATAKAIADPNKQVVLPGQKDPCDAEATHADLGPLAETHISGAQVDYFRRELAKHPDAAQIIVLMHRPAWRTPASPAFTEIQKMLHGHPYTVFAGHYHEYGKETIDGAEYYITGPTAALPRCAKDARYRNQLLEVTVEGNHLSTHQVMLPPPGGAAQKKNVENK